MKNLLILLAVLFFNGTQAAKTMMVDIVNCLESEEEALIFSHVSMKKGKLVAKYPLNKVYYKEMIRFFFEFDESDFEKPQPYPPYAAKIFFQYQDEKIKFKSYPTAEKTWDEKTIYTCSFIMSYSAKYKELSQGSPCDAYLKCNDKDIFVHYTDWIRLVARNKLNY